MQHCQIHYWVMLGKPREGIFCSIRDERMHSSLSKRDTGPQSCKQTLKGELPTACSKSKNLMILHVQLLPAGIQDA